MASTRVRTSQLTPSGTAVEYSSDGDALMAFVPEDQISSVHGERPPEIDPTWASALRSIAVAASLVPFGFGVAVGVFVAFLLPSRFVRDAAIPASPPAFSASRLLNVSRETMVPRSSSVPAAQLPHASSISAGVEHVAAIPAKREAAGTAVASPSRSRSLSPRALRPTQRSASPTTMARYRGSLAVNSSPNGASVFVNGFPVGITPLVLNDVPAGSRVVRVEMDGYERWTSAVRVVANTRVVTEAALQPSSNP